MKKRNLIASCLMLTSIIAGCSCNKEKIDTRANVSYESQTVSSNKGDSITVGEIYDYILTTQEDAVSKTILTKVLEKQLGFSDSDPLSLYIKYLNEYFTTTFVENNSYKENGEFSEELLVSYLKSESYDIKCGAGVNSGLLDSTKFSCDYSDYIEKKLNSASMISLYKKYLNEYFMTTFVESDSYKYNGEFSEELLVSYLKSESYDIKCGTGVNSGLLDNTKFSCDYSDYIEKEANYDIYMKLLKIKYIIDEKSNLIDKNAARKISYYSVSKGSTDNEIREKLEKYVSSIVANYNSEDENLIRSIEDVAEANRKEELDVIADDFAKVSTSSDSSAGYTYLNKFTTCENGKRCTLEEGKAYQEKLLMEKEYYVTKVVIKENADVLYEGARNLLFSENVNDYLYKIGDKNYLMSPAYLKENDKRANDLILFDSSSNKYYLATVDIITSQSSFEDKVSVAEILIEKISDSTILDYCFEDLDVKIFDKDVKEYFESKYGKLEK